VLFLVLIQLGIHAYLERQRPEVYDPEYSSRLAVLNQRRREAPERPLLLVVGSSRLVTDFLPEQLPPLTSADGQPVLPFNFSHTGAGPLVNLMEVERLFRAGVRPRWLVVEVLPPMLNISGRSTAAGIARADDLGMLAQHMPAWKAYGSYLLWRLLPSPRHYVLALDSILPTWVCRPTTDAGMNLGPLGGSAPLHTAATSDNVHHYTEAVRAQYFPGLQHFHVTGVADQSLRHLLEACQTEGVEVVLLLTPESSEFRSWYPESARRHVDSYCTALSQAYGVRVVDARTWIADADFIDAHHAIPRGAEAFTRRLAQELLQPLVAGKLAR
jgi:hypothetical protein